MSLAKKLSAGAVVAIASGGLFAPAAFAASSTPSTTPTNGSSAQPADAGRLAELKAKAAAAISTRESALSAAVTDVSNNPYLTSTDRATILGVLNSDESDLSALGATIQADTNLAQAQADYQSIFTTYRVFALRLPQARFAESADDLTGTVLPALNGAQATLQALLAGPDHSKDTPQVQAAMTDLAAQINTVSSDTNGLSASVLAITPAQWNADPVILLGPRGQLASARSAAHKAEADIEFVVKAIQ